MHTWFEHADDELENIFGGKDVDFGHEKSLLDQLHVKRVIHEAEKHVYLRDDEPEDLEGSLTVLVLTDDTFEEHQGGSEGCPELVRDGYMPLFQGLIPCFLLDDLALQLHRLHVVAEVVKVDCDCRLFLKLDALYTDL